MAALDFPSSPSVGQTFSSGSIVWVYDGSKWVIDNSNYSGWINIGIGSSTSHTTITVPTGCRRVRVSWHALCTDTSYLYLRVNGDTSSNLHSRTYGEIDGSGAYSGTSDGSQGTVWFIGAFLGTLTTWGKAEVDLTTLRPKCFAESYRPGIPSGSKRFYGWGWMEADRTVTTLQFSTQAGGGTLSGFNWTAEGLMG